MSRPFVLLLLLLSLLLRFSALIGNHLHWDEPFWMVRGDFFVHSVLTGNTSDLQTRHWTIQVAWRNFRKLTPRIGTGSVTAILTGAGVEAGRWLPRFSPPDEAFKFVFAARAFHALVSAVTPVLFLLLLRSRLGDVGALAIAFFVMFEPVIHFWGGMAHLEAVLTLAAPISLLLYEFARERRSAVLLVVGGALFGLAFSNRANAGAVPVALCVYLILQFVRSRVTEPSWWRSMGREAGRLMIFSLTGWVVFVILYPPLWRAPLTGFWAFLMEYAARTTQGTPAGLTLQTLFEAHSWLSKCFLSLAAGGLLVRDVRSRGLFQLGGAYYVVGLLFLALSPRFVGERYLSSVLPGLAIMGGCVVAFLWNRWAGESDRSFRRARGALAVLAAVSSSVILIQAWGNYSKIRGAYRQLDSLHFSEVHFVRQKVKFVRDGTGGAGPRLFVTTNALQLPAVYLDVWWTDKRRLDEVRPGWIKMVGREKACLDGDWQFERTSQAKPSSQPQLVGYQDLSFWPCSPD